MSLYVIQRDLNRENDLVVRPEAVCLTPLKN